MTHSDDEALTVAQLIEKLQQIPQDTRVYTEGCDCTGNAADVEYNKHFKCAYITREKVK